MKVLHLWKSDSAQYGGGGAVSMYRLHSGLRTSGIDSNILCERKTTDSPYVHTIASTPGLTLLDKLLKQVTSRLGLNDVHRLSSFKINQHQAYIDADILHFHGIHGGFINYLALPSLTANKPAVFSLCDMWAMTGHCGFSFDCDRWKTGCGKCPYPNTRPAIKRDATHLEWRLKDWIYNHSNLSIISKSSWLTALAKQSLLNRFPIYQIANGIDTTIYQPLDREQCRLELEIPLDKKVLMFSAVELNDFRKGADLLLKALQNLPVSLKAETVLLTFGKAGEEIAKDVEMQTYDLGYISDEQQKAIAYCAADLFLFPTRAETFGNVALESIACGTPVVSFKVGGVGDHVRHDITGYLATPEDYQDFSYGIVQLLEDDNFRTSLSQQCREVAVREYSLELCVQQHAELYSRLLQN
ncbi:glycosyltransferase [Aliterella atlantica]|uniref:Glycosyl transferase n=1 Tax=Aliterella atlantica CENA595 TaxID=1618023 RepID=A0A0D8ZU96_9CYAN|nr:glycosyltransferase [Aliterella atlantica]KJH72034.1 glycosyl transferase [Aliterella atlantica CENA595]